MSDSCPNGEMCDLSHDPTPHRVSACHHFLRGNCSNENCRYAHVRVNPAAPVCRPFATLGYCPKGAECTERHTHECPDYDATGVCGDPKCKLQHVERAGRKRAAAAAAERAKNTPNDEDDHSSGTEAEGEEEDSIHSDVDSEMLDVDDMDFIRNSATDETVLKDDFIKF